MERFGKGVVLWDGAMGTMLMERGLGQGECPEVWNDSHPERVKSVHSAYFEAGSDVVQTNTFGGSRLKLEVNGLGDSVPDLNFKAARLAREVCPDGRYVAGDIGPTGMFLKPTGTHTFEELKEVFAEQARALADGGVHFFSVETMFDIEEAKAAIAGIKSASSLPIAAEVSFNRTPRGFFTLMGNDVESCIRSLIEVGADIVGSNCSLGSGEMVELVKIMRAYAGGKPLIAQANAGQPTLVDGRTVYPTGPDDFLVDVAEMLDSGLNAVGGCCGTNHEFIMRIREHISSRE